MADLTQDELDAQLLGDHGLALDGTAASSPQNDPDAALLNDHGLGPAKDLASAQPITPAPLFGINPNSPGRKAWDKMKLLNPLSWDLSTGNNDVDTTPALFPASDYARGIVETPIAEAAKQLQAGVHNAFLQPGQKPQQTNSMNALKEALLGRAKSGDENLGDLGMKKGLVRSGLGLVGDTFANPTTSMWEGAWDEVPQMSKLAAILKQAYASVPFSESAVDTAGAVPGKVSNALSSIGDPISNIISGLGDKVFRNTRFIRDAEKELTTGRNSAKLPAGAAGDVLGNLGLSGSDKNISDQIFKARQAKGAEIGDAINTAGEGGDLQVELAKDFNQNARRKMGNQLGLSDDDMGFLDDVKSSHPDVVNDAIIAESKKHSAMASQAEEAAAGHDKAATELEKLVKSAQDSGDEATAATIEPHARTVRGLSDSLSEQAQDARYKANALQKLQSQSPKEWIMDRLSSESPRVQQSAVDDLHELAPNFSPLWKRVGDEIGRSGGADSALATTDSALSDIARGPRTLNDTAQVGYDWNQVAAGSKPMRTNKYLQNSKPDTKNELAMELGGTIADIVDSHVSDAVDSAPELANYPKLKSDYSVLAKAGNRAQQTVRNAMSRPPVGKATMIAALAALKTGGLPLLAKGAVAHGVNELYQSPQFGVGVSNALKNFATSSVPDNLLRQSVINSYRQPTPPPANPWANLIKKGDGQ